MLRQLIRKRTMPAANGRALTTKGRTALTKQGIMERGLGRRALMLVVLAAAVALGAFLVVRPAEAADVPLAADANSATAAPGDTVQITVARRARAGEHHRHGRRRRRQLRCERRSVDQRAADNLVVRRGRHRGQRNPGRPERGRGLLRGVHPSSASRALAGLRPTAKVTKVITVSKATLLGSLDGGDEQQDDRGE